MASHEQQWKWAQENPHYFLDFVKCVDNTTGEEFKFQLLHEEDPWFWQREVLDEWIDGNKAISLKARQIGITWLAAGYALYHLVCVPGTKVLVVSINLTEAQKVVGRIWDMFLSLPDHLKPVKVVKPRGQRPSQKIELQHKGGKISSVISLPSTKSAGHGETAALVILDEFSRQEYAAETWKACLPTTQKEGGRILVISTGNGVSNDRGGGNFFHHLWVNAEQYGLVKRFMPWNLHPDRDDAWYEQHAAALPSADRGEQYPKNPKEAFILTGRPYFDVDALLAYEEHGGIMEPIYRFDFVEEYRRARKVPSKDGFIRVYREPVDGRNYAIGADVATGRGQDYSAAYVVDLSDMALVCEFHGKLDADVYATQLHFLGQWYNTAHIAVETGGGYGEAVIIPLRDGRSGRPPYPKLYKHVLSSRPDLPVAKPFGFPMNTKTRPLVISQLEAAIREKELPWLTQRLFDEAITFIHADTTPSPRAQDGCNDDAVMAAAVTLEMYRLKGNHPMRTRRRKEQRERARSGIESSYPWQEPNLNLQEQAEKRRQRRFDQRYAKEAA